MQLKNLALLATAGIAPSVTGAATLRFSCSQLVVERLDPLVNPGENPSPHLHQVVGGNAFNVSMDPTVHDLPTTATCTSCTPVEDFSNYWTAVLFFKARNGTLHRVNTFGNELGFSQAKGGQTVYYLSSGKVTAFKPGFRMTVGDPAIRTADELNKRYKYMDFTCLQSSMTRGGQTTHFPTQPCAAGIMVSIRFPTCWDGKNVDSPDHQSHVAYPVGNACPSTHPVTIPQVFYETYWDTRPFNNKAEWPADGSQPFVWSFGDQTGYGIHGDYVFGWKGDALQRAMDANCNSDLFANQINCPTLQTQSLDQANQCTKPKTVTENLDGWLTELPGGMPIS
ncbi:uncharacterized protein F4807DRAFT_93823 [Annulohypoxylon truncatum]|uniref:uncharacterized protein n=1 Tax=Annulohypoxylon truncatum TaxID=327061 RepID=UPI0020073615|nr:uncharacterized protein F4807DRAFT_93823 [Annulohypoxylon truncatum]KAI1209444.1 hypothetical protein F4807DRAFT_93823 [Annulohypoxylon truncatum]